jgi:ectoine hydroxylase-related dioxygenase (phytanoyl-CoA dioxygenase family)
MNANQSNRVQLFRERGYFIVPAFLETPELAELRRACDLVLERARAESSVKGHTSPSVSLFADTGNFARWPGSLERLLTLVASARVCALLEGLAHADEERTPRLQKVDYYHEQTRRDWDGDWHRDSQFKEHDPQREYALLLRTTAVHLRFALSPDDRLELVEGSHRRWDSREELRVRKGAQRSTADMPNATRVALRAGDACVFHAWAIHRATYQRAPLRRTLDSLYAFGQPHQAQRW